MTRERDAGEAARRAEPKGIGSGGARDPLAREVKLLGALLGQVIVEQEGPELFELVEQLRRAAIRNRRSGEREPIDAALHSLDGRSSTELLAVARAFTSPSQRAMTPQRASSGIPAHARCFSRSRDALSAISSAEDTASRRSARPVRGLRTSSIASRVGATVAIISPRVCPCVTRLRAAR